MFSARYWFLKRRPIITTMVAAIFCLTLYILTQQKGTAITLTSVIREVSDQHNTASEADDRREYIHQVVFSEDKLHRNLKHYKHQSSNDNQKRVSGEEFPKSRFVSDDGSRDKIYVDEELTTDYKGEYSQNADSVHNSSLQKIQRNATRRLPQAIVIGVKKCGTRALLEFLRLHPDVRSPGPEPHFFDRHYEKGLDWYREKMPPTLEGQITVEKTPSYFITKEVPARVLKMYKDTKLIVVVRNPVTRAISDYTQTRVKKPTLPSFEKFVFMNNNSRVVDTSWTVIKVGVYCKHLENWLRYFPIDQFHFVSGENLISDPAGELAKVQDFLGIKRIISNKHFYFNQTRGFPCLKKPEGSGRPHCLGKTKGRQHPYVNPSTIQRLSDFYRPFNAKFYQMVKRSFDW